MLSLVIDTATKYLYLALIKDNKVLGEVLEEGKKDHSGKSLFNIDKLLKDNGYKASDLDSVYCGYGPGSYTGVRISVTISKMLASLRGVKLYAISSLYLAGSGYDNKNVAVMFDARRGNVFSALFGDNLMPDKLRNQEEFLNEVANLDDLVVVSEDNMKVNPLKAITKAIEISEGDGFVPNYLRISEAEYNLEHKND